MTAFTATGWALGITYSFIVIAVVLAKMRPGSEHDVVSGLACQAIAYLIGLFVILRVHAPDAGIRDFLGVRPTHWLFYPLAVLLGAALFLPGTVLYGAIERLTHHEPESQMAELFDAASPPRKALTALVVILFGPTLEEVLFRGALFRPMLKVHPAPMVIGVTATLFALAHGEYQSFLPIGILGIALGMLRRASGSLAPTILLHATFNAVSFYSMAAHKEWDVPPWLIGASTLAAVALLACVRLVGARAHQAAIAQNWDRQ
jgi:uncharacterized protein